MRELGHVVRLQIQRSSLKTGEKPHRLYDPAPILTVERLSVSPDGALGEVADDAWMVDIHHRMHPSTKNPDGEHGISLDGLTAHELATQLGTVLVWQTGGTSFVLAGSLPPAAAEAAARAVK